MKKLTAAIAALALFLSASASGPEPVNELNALLNPSAAKVIKSEKVGKWISSAFNAQFENATELRWKENDGLYFGYFKQLDRDQMVAYTYNGELFAVVRQLELKELPTAIQEKLSGKYKNCSVNGNISEVVIQGDISYYVSAEDKKSTRVIKFLSDGQDEVIQKTKKKMLVGTVM